MINYLQYLSSAHVHFSSEIDEIHIHIYSQLSEQCLCRPSNDAFLRLVILSKWWQCLRTLYVTLTSNDRRGILNVPTNNLFSITTNKPLMLHNNYTEDQFGSATEVIYEQCTKCSEIADTCRLATARGHISIFPNHIISWYRIGKQSLRH